MDYLEKSKLRYVSTSALYLPLINPRPHNTKVMVVVMKTEIGGI